MTTNQAYAIIGLAQFFRLKQAGKGDRSLLVLSRQRDETIMIGDDVEITVVGIRGDKVRLGINAPRHIQVHRKEVYERIKRKEQQVSIPDTKDSSKPHSSEEEN